MTKYIISRVQVLPASFLIAVCASVIFTMSIAMQLGVSLATYADKSMSLADNLMRVNLIKQVTRMPDLLKAMDEDKIAILLRNPALKRKEMDVSALHYHGISCSLVIYFSKGNNKPDFVEYRALSMNADISAQFEETDQSSLNQYCIKDILEAQGVDTPSNFARQPTPTWDNPYRT